MANTNRPTYTEVDAAAALRLFKGQSIVVQTARPGKRKGEDGVERTVMITEDKDLAPDHVLSAKQWSNGRVSITTIDGKRYEVKGSIGAAPKDEQAK